MGIGADGDGDGLAATLEVVIPDLPRERAQPRLIPRGVPPWWWVR